MFQDLLYALTPRDSQSLTLEVRSVSHTFTIPNGSAAGANTSFSGFSVPKGRIALVLAAGVAFVPGGLFNQTFNSIGFQALDAGGTPRMQFANKHEQTIAPSANNETIMGLWVASNAILLPDEIPSFFWSFTSAAPAGDNVPTTARLRLLLMPRGNIGV